MPTIAADVRDLHRVVVLNTIALVGSVRSADLDSPTPCADWNLGDLLAHMTAQHRGFAAATRGCGDEAEVWRPDTIREAIAAKAAYEQAAGDVLTAFADDAVLDAPFALPEFGPGATFPGAVAIGFHFVDYVVHGWDVAESLGLAYTLPDDVVDAALPLALAVPDGDFRQTPHAPFARALNAPNEPNATNLARVLRHLGRSPDWTRQ